MALKSHVIRDALLDLAKNPPRNAVDSARRYAAMYGRYATDARTVLGNAPASLTAAEATLAAALIPVFTGFGRPSQLVAQQMAQAFTAFWLLPPVVTAGSFPGLVTAVAGTAALGPAMVAAWAANVASKATNQQAAQRMADALHAFTLTVVVTEATAPTPTVGPIV